MENEKHRRRGGARPGAGRKASLARRNMTLSVSEDTIKRASSLRNEGIKVNRLVENAIMEKYTFWIEGRL